PDAAAFRAAVEELIAALGMKGSGEDASAYLHGLYADRIAAERDESKQDVLSGTLDEETSSASLPGEVKSAPAPAPAEEEDDAANEETLPADGVAVRRVTGEGPRQHTTSLVVPPLESSRWRRFAALAAAVLLLGGATTAAALYARARHQAAP